MRYKTDSVATSFSLGEVIANSITHAIGAGLSIAGLVILIIRAANRGDSWHMVSFIIFGISLILLYLASAMYHATFLVECYFAALGSCRNFFPDSRNLYPISIDQAARPLWVEHFWNCVGVGSFGVDSIIGLYATICQTICMVVCCHGLVCYNAVQSDHSAGWQLELDLLDCWRYLLHVRDHLLPLAQPSLQPCYLARLCYGGQHFPLLFRPTINIGNNLLARHSYSQPWE